eukprot:gene10194-2613_t
MNQNLERAIEILFDPINNTKEQQNEANNYLSQYLNTSNSIFEFSLNYLKSNFYSKKSQSLFWCLQKLIQLYKQNEEYKNVNTKILHNEILKLIKNFNGTEEIYILNKLSELISLIFHFEYLTNWNSFFNDILLLSKINEHCCYMILLILNSIFDSNFERTTSKPEEEKIKNLKKEMKKKDIKDIIQFIISILNLKHFKLTKFCLLIYSKYIEWIDFEFILMKQNLELIYNLIQMNEFKNESCFCLNSILKRGMFPLDKLNLLNFIQIFNFLNSIHFDQNNIIDKEYFGNISNLISTLGNEIIELNKSFMKDQSNFEKSMNMLNTIIPISLKYLNFKILSENLISFLLEYVLFINKFKCLNEFHSKCIKEIILICKRNIKMNSILNINENDDEYLNFQEYRNEMMILYKNSSLIEKDFCLNLIQIEFENVKNLNEKSNVEDVELSLFLFFEYPEIFSSLYLKNEFFKSFFVLILESGRYNKIIIQNEYLIKYPIELFFSKEGIINSNNLIQKRSCFLFKNFIKNLKKMLKLDEILFIYQQIKNILFSNDFILKEEERFFLFESLGYLISNQLTKETISIINEIVNYLMNDILSKELSESNLILKNLLILKNFLKGFTTNSNNLDIKDLFKRILMSLKNVFEKYEKLNLKTEIYSLLKTILIILKNEILNDHFYFIFLKMFKSISNNFDYFDFLNFNLEILHILKKETLNLFNNDIFNLIISNTLELLKDFNQNDIITMNEIDRSKSEIHKVFIQFITSILEHECSILILSMSPNYILIDQLIRIESIRKYINNC